MKNLFKYLVVHPLLVLLLVVVLLVSALALLSLTQTGTGLLVQLAERALPSLTLHKVGGTLVSQVEAESLVWENDGIRVEAQQAVFKPNIELKFPLNLVVKQLTARKLVVDLPPSEDKPYEPFVLPDLRLPVEAELDNVSLDELVINQGETEIIIRDVVLEAYTRSDTLYLEKLDGILQGQFQALLMQASGEMGLDEPHPLQLNARINADSKVLGSGELMLAASGELQAYQAELKGHWQYASYPEYQVNMLGEGNLEGMMLEDVRLNSRAGNATLQGKLVWSPYLDWNLQGAAENFKPEFFSKDIKGDITLALNSSGNFEAEPVAKLEVTRLEGRLREFPLDATLNAELQGKDLLLRALDVRVGDNRLTASGQADEQLNINWQLAAEQLSQFHPDLNGTLKGQGMLSGKVDGSAFQLGIEQLVGKVMDYPVAAEGHLALQDQVITARNLQLKVGDNQLQMDGVADETQGIDWSLTAAKLEQLYPELSGQLKGQGNAKGLLDGSRLALRIDQLAGEVSDYPVAAVGAIRIEGKQLSAEDLKINVGDNRVTLNGQADEDRGIDWRVDAPKLAAFHPDLQGQLKGQGNARGLLDGSRAVLQIAELTGQVQGYPLQAAGAVRVDGKRLSAENLQIHVGENRLGLNGQTDELSGINWELVAPDLKTLHPELAGKLQGKGNVKGLLDGSRLALRIEELTGQVKEYPLQAAGEVRLADQVLTANNLRLNVGRNRVLLDGAANTDKGVRWRVDAPALAELAPGLQGQLKGNGKLSGRLDGSQFAVEVAQLSGRVNGFPLNAQGGLSRKKGGFAVDDLQVSLGQNRVRLDGRVNQRQGIHWRLNAPRLADINPSLRGSLQGKGAIRGLTDDSQLSVQIVQLNGRVMDYPLSASGHVSLQGQRLSANKLLLNVGENTLNLNGVLDEQTGLGWSLNAPKLVQLSPALDGQLKGRGHLKGDLEAALMTLNIAELNGRVRGFPVNALGTVQLRDKKQLQLSQLRLNVGANAVRLNGSLDEVRGIDWQLDARKLVQLNPALDGQLRGHGHLKGALESSRFAVRVNTLTGRVRQYPVQLSGEVTSDGKNVTAHNVLLNSGQNTVKLNGSLGKSAGLDWQLDARNIGQLVPGVKASAKGNGTLSGQLDGPNLTVQVARLSGQVDGRPLTARGAVSLRGEKISLAGVQVSAGGNNQLALQGDVSEPLNLSWKINGRNLAQAWPGLAGGLQGEGTVRGTLARPQLKGFLKGSNVRYQDTSVQALDINISQSGAEYHVQGVLRNLQQGDHVLTHAEIKGQGTVERHSGTLAAVHKDGKLNVSVSGGLKGGRWDGAVNTLALRDTVAGDWQLTAPIRMSASDKAVTVTNSCLVNRQNARLCTQADWSAPGGLVAKGQLQQIPLAMARSFLPDNIQLPGRVSADYQFEQRGGKPFARVNVQLPDNVMVVVSKRGRKDTFRYTNARADLVLNNRNATIEARLDVVGHGQLRTQGQVILSPENNQHRVDLRTTLNMPSITRLQRFSPQVDALKGSVTGDVRVAGLLNRPQVTGALRLQNGSLYLPETGSRLNDINLTVQANRADQLSINGTLRAGSGQLTANGTLRLAQLPDWSADVRIAGQDLLLMNSHEIQAKVSPDLNVKAGPQSVVITGTVRIPETTVTLRELPSSASVRSDDIVIVGKGRPQPRKVTIAPDSGKPLYIRPDVMIELGERVSFSGFGLDARMTGRMRLLRNRQDIVAEGRLNVIDGVYKAYGQNLKIERGRLLFSGPVDNPGLDVRATREVENDITVGIAVNGTVRNPESSLFSTPPQTQTDTLSYLLTGHALSGVKGAESAILSQAVTGLGLSGGESLAQQLGGSLGLDDVGLNATGGDYKQSELSLGKRLGPKLYVKYIVGLFDSLQKIAVTYDINKKLQLEATSGIQQSVDLIYKIDTNRGPFGN